MYQSKAIDITEFFLKNGLSKHGDQEVIYKAIPLSLKASEAQSDGRVRVEGWMSTEDVDLVGDKILATAWKKYLADFKRRGTMLFMHDWWAVPIGKFDVVEVKEGKGLWVEGDILPTSQGKDVQMMVDADVLDAFSVGFTINKAQDGEDGDDFTRLITEAKPFEGSIVNAGMNPTALFTQVKSLGLSEDFSQYKTASSDHRGANNGRSQMDLTPQQVTDLAACTKMIGEKETALEKNAGDISSLQTNIQEQGDRLKEVVEQNKKLAEGTISKDEAYGLVKKQGEEILELQKQIQTGRAGAELKDKQIPINDWRLMEGAEQICMYRDDNGRPLGTNAQKAYNLFSRPVEYKGEFGDWLKNLRDLHSTVAVVGAYMRGVHGKSFNVANLQSAQLLYKMVESHDADFAKAMYSTGTGVGDEWVPTLMDSNLFDLLRLTPSLEGFIPSFEMPSNPYLWPIKTSGATLYRAAEATVNNPDQLTRSDVGTGQRTFNAEAFAVAISVSPELIEDAIIPMVSEINSEISFEMRDGYEGLLVNGDNTTTHRDTGGSYTSINPESYEDGFRFLAIDGADTINMKSASAGVGDGAAAFASGDIRSIRKLMGKYGKRPQDLLYVVNPDVWMKVLSMDEFARPGTYEAGNTWRTGDLQMIDGSTLYISEHMDNDQSASGLNLSAANTIDHSSILCLNKTRFKIGSRRGVTLETEKNIMTQQWNFVGTMRKSFQKMDPTAQPTVTLGYGIPTAGV